MSDGKPVEVMRSALGGWYSVSQSKDLGGGTRQALRRNPISNAGELEKLYDANSWLNTLMRETGKTREQIAADYDLTIHAPNGGRP